MLWSANGTPGNFCRRGQLFGAWKAVKVNDAVRPANRQRHLESRLVEQGASRHDADPALALGN
jgi:hypothetical protein